MTFSDESVAALEISITSGGTCDDVDCSGAGDCDMNAADFPVCACDPDWKANGFDCVPVDSCMLADDIDKCVDFAGSAWTESAAKSQCTTFSGTYSADLCVDPADETWIGSCLVEATAGDSATQFVVNYYDEYWDETAAQSNCENVMGGSWSAP